MLNPRVPGDTIWWMFLLTQGEKFCLDSRKLSKFLYDQSQKPEYASLFKNFIFDESQSFPQSETVTSALAISNLYLESYCDSDIYWVSEGALAEFNRLKNIKNCWPFSLEEIGSLEKLAADFLKAFPTKK